MKVETPQILWNNQSDSRVPAALYSVSILESGICCHHHHHAPNHHNTITPNHGDKNSPTSTVMMMSDSKMTKTKHGNILATAGTTHEINLWSLDFPQYSDGGNQQCSPITIKPIVPQRHSKASSTTSSDTKISYLCSLSRHERTVNVVRFSPNGLHLATGGDSGSIIVWSVPVCKRGGNHGHHFWSTITKETDLTVRIIPGNGDGVCDISWSADSKRFVVGTVDHCLVVYEDASYDSTTNHHHPPQAESQWKAVFRNTSDHTNFIQGVSYDPLGVYITSMSNDRSVKVYARKTPTKSKKKILRPTNAPKGPFPPPEHQDMVSELLTESKFLVFGKAKTIKYRKCTLDETGTQIKHHLFADESTLESFFRRPTWTTDGAFFMVPAGLWHNNLFHTSSKVPPNFAIFFFARHRFDQPCKVLYGLEKPAVVIRPHPKLFQLPPQELNDSKENRTLDHRLVSSVAGLPYRSVFAVLTLDSVLVYDTFHTKPIVILRGLHYAALTDCCWSQDGKCLIVCSSDGYISLVHFGDGELGPLYEPPPKTSPPPPPPAMMETTTELLTTMSPAILASNENNHLPLMNIPPHPISQSLSSNQISSDGDANPTTIEAPPTKRAKKTRIVPVLLSSSMSSPPTTVVIQANSIMNHPIQEEQQQQQQLPPPPTHDPKDQKECVEGYPILDQTWSSPAMKRMAPTPPTKDENETDRVGLAVTKLSILDCQTMVQTTSTTTTQHNNFLVAVEPPPKKKKRIQPTLIATSHHPQ